MLCTQACRSSRTLPDDPHVAPFERGQADVASTCTTQGGDQAPRQNSAPTTATGSVAIPESEITNGNTPSSVTPIAPTTPIPGAPGCPNLNRTESIDALAFTSATITVAGGYAAVVMTTGA